ncbi:MAG: glucose PTS transporter subunit IIA [Tissierellia bacterium]|nr:glucose PTS transporter subunit IIA [Tissierellia bacterium]
MKENKLFGIMQRVGRSFMLPIAILPVAGLFLGIGGSFTNETMLNAYGLTEILGPGTIPNAILTVMKAAGEIVFANLPIIFAIGVAIGMAKQEKATAALAGAIAFFVMHASISAMININGGVEKLLAGSTTMVVGINSLQMGVFGGIIVGLGVSSLHNKYYKIELPQVLSFFGGTRFVPIISAIVYLAVGILMFYAWPPVQAAINAVGNLVRGSGYLGTWVYGLMERALIPFGLHHVFYLPFWQTAVGGSMEVAGKVVEGAQNIFFAQLADPSTQHFSVEATRFMSGKFPLMIFGLPGAALAMYKTAIPDKRKLVGGLLFSAALTSMLTGITEPLEFTFLFVAPLLYGIHCVLAGLAYMFMHILNVGVGMTFSGGFIDMLLFGIMQGNAKTNWLFILLVGIVYFAVYYLLFSFLIVKLNLMTPGRDETEEVKLYTRADVNAKDGVDSKDGKVEIDEKSYMIAQGLGGHKNIIDADNCATRLRCTVADPSLVRDDILKSTGAAGVMKSGNGVQVIYGPQVSVIKSNLDEYLANPVDDELVESSEPIKSDDKEERDLKASDEKLKEEIILYAPIKGEAIELKDVPDPAFAQGILGKGMAIKPEIGKLVSPVNGSVAMLFDTKHAIGIMTDKGMEILIHIGMDTVNLKGRGFKAYVENGDKIKIGDPLIDFDLEILNSEGYHSITPIVITNSDEFPDIDILNLGEINIGDEILKIGK